MSQGYIDNQVENRASLSDEIDLFDLWDDIVENKVWVLAGLFSCIVIAAGYLMRATEVFETQVVIKPVSDIHILELNPPQLNPNGLNGPEDDEESSIPKEKEIFSLTSDQAYKEAQKAILSKEYRKTFFNNHISVMKGYESIYSDRLMKGQNFANFDQLFNYTVSNEKKDTEEFTKLTFEFPDSEKSAELLNAYVVFALVKKLDEIKSTLNSKVQSEILNLQYKVDQLKEEYRGNRNRTLLLLNEAKHVADSMGLKKPAFDKNQVLSQSPPRYMYGSKALAAEMKAIQNRDAMAQDISMGEEFFIRGVPELMFKIDQLKKLKVDYAKVKLATIDEQAIPPTSPAKPKKLLILALAVVAGVFLGVMLALIVSAFKRHQETRRRRALQRLEKKNR